MGNPTPSLCVPMKASLGSLYVCTVLCIHSRLVRRSKGAFGEDLRIDDTCEEQNKRNPDRHTGPRLQYLYERRFQK